MSYIEFIEIQDSTKKTKQFYISASNKVRIRNKSNFTDVLGYITFYPQWRKYVFHPNTDVHALFDAACLLEISLFCKTQTNEWRQNLTYKEDQDVKI
jgi:hypothetical protein